MLLLGVGTPPYIGPGDITSGASFFLGLQPYNRATFNAAQVIKLRRSSDSAEADYGFVNGYLNQTAIATWGGVSATGTGSITGAALTFTGGVIGGQVTGGTTQPGTFIISGTSPNWTVNLSQTVASTTITVANAMFVTTLYDQSGNGVNGVQAATAKQLVLLLNVLRSGTMPVMSQIPSVPVYVTVTLGGAIAQPLTLVTVLNAIATTAQTVLGDTSNARNTAGHSAANTMNLNLGTAVTATATDGTPFTYIGTGNGASSVINISGTETSVNPNTGSFGPVFNFLSNQAGGGSGSLWSPLCAGWPSVLDATARAGLTTNLKAWWGIA